MERITRYGLTWYTFSNVKQKFRHALLTRLGGVSHPPFASLNLGHTVGDLLHSVSENHRRVREAFGLSHQQIVSPRQVHRARVVSVTEKDGGMVIPACDALITDVPHLALLLRFADCTPILFYDPVHHVAGLGHAGWRGVAANIVAAIVKALSETYGSLPQDLWAGVGPAINAENYEVGEEVVKQVREALPSGASVFTKLHSKWHLDLPGAVEAQLRAVGVGRIEPSHLHTASNTEEWYSHRAEHGWTGRFGVLVMLT